MEWFRPMVQTKAWDYVIVWKYGDDPTRFIEWMGCCCSGGCNNGSKEQVNTEEEKVEEYRLTPICRDSQFQHPVRTKACEALAQLPNALPLYYGVHGDVAISKQPRWLAQDSRGTQVLIPILGGLIELFTAKLIPKDTRMIEVITAHCCVSMKKEAMSAQKYTSLCLSEHPPSEEYYPESLISSVHVSHPSIEGSSSGSNPSNETSEKQQTGLGFNCGTLEEEKSEIFRRPHREGFISKNLVTERNRRKRIKDALFTLRSLVPKITKMDKASILGDAIDYIKEVQEQVKGLEDEIRGLEEEKTPQLRRPMEKEKGGTRSFPLTDLIQRSSVCTKKPQIEVQVEVNQIGRRNFFIKLYCEQKRGGFAKLMEALHSFGLEVADASVNTIDGKVLNILAVEADKQDIHPKILREYLTEQAGSW